MSERFSKPCLNGAASATAVRVHVQTVRAMVAKGAMPPRVLEVDDVHAAADRMKARGVEFTPQPVARFGSVDAGFRDPSGNGWKLVQTR